MADMKFITDLSKGILGEPDSPELWIEILTNIPDELLVRPNIKILNISFGYATEAMVLSKRMLSLGVSKDDIADSLWMVDKYHVFANRAVRKGYTNIVTTDFLDWKTNMKFDVIIGNPPYQDPTGQNTIYPKFYAKAIQLAKPDAYIAMITPPAIIPGLWGVKDPDGIKMPAPIQIDYIKVGNCVKDHFVGVSSDFCYFILQNKQSVNNSVTVETDAGTVVAAGPIFPRETSDIKLAQSILNKCFSFYKDAYEATSGDHGKKAHFDPNGTHLAVESISTTKQLKTRPITWTGTAHKHFNSPKVIMPMYGKVAIIDYTHNLVSASQEKLADGTKLTGHNIITILTKSNAESESLLTLLESRLQRFFNAVTNETRAPYVNFIKNFIGVPLNRLYTDDVLESTLNLTTEEKAWLNANY
jgi:hypothetical protein